MFKPGGGSGFPLFPESESEFFLKIADVQVEFVKDDKGQFSSLIVHQNGHDMKAVRK
jgi:hypothetical protein